MSNGGLLEKAMAQQPDQEVSEVIEAEIIETSDLINKELKNSNVFIITVPTPIMRNNIPDLSYLKYASEIVGKNLKSSAKKRTIYEAKNNISFLGENKIKRKMKSL